MTPREQAAHDAWASAGEEREEPRAVYPRTRVIHLYIDANPEARAALADHPALVWWQQLAGVDLLRVHSTTGPTTATARGWSTAADEDRDHEIAAEAVTVADAVLDALPCPNKGA